MVGLVCCVLFVNLGEGSENKSISTLLLLFGDLLEEGVNDGDCKHDTCAATDSAHEVGKDAKSTNADTTADGGDMNVAGNVFNHRLLTVVHNSHFLVHQVLDDVTRGRAAHIDPDTREERTGAHDKCAVEEAVEGVTNDVGPLTRRADVISKTADGGRLA